MPPTVVLRFALLLVGLLGIVGPGLPANPAWALGAGAPPIIRSASVVFDRSTSGGLRLLASVTVEIPGGTIPENVQRVQVTLPSSSVATVPLDQLDLAVENSYLVNLSAATGVQGAPPGTYTFRVTDTSGGITQMAVDLPTVNALDNPTSLTLSDLTAVPADAGGVNLLNPATNPTPIASWSTVPGAANYQLTVRNGFNDQNLLFIATTATTVRLPAGVFQPGRRHFVRVRALDANSLARSNTQIEVITKGPEIILSQVGSADCCPNVLTISARVFNHGPSVTVSARAWLGVPRGGTVPNGTVVPILSVDGVVIPTNLNADFFNGPVFTNAFGLPEPAGDYVFGVRLIDPVTGETIAVAIRTFHRTTF